jgi:hypothetical protein
MKKVIEILLLKNLLYLFFIYQVSFIAPSHDLTIIETLKRLNFLLKLNLFL